MENKEQWECRWSPSLGELESTAEEVWGTHRYISGGMSPKIFFGVYGLPDFYEIWRQKARKAILWAGSDIIHLKNGYWLEDGGSIRLSHRPIATWLNKHCENYCENAVEAMALQELGIKAEVIPSFLGDINKFPVCFKPQHTVRLYTSVSGNNFEMYGWDKILELAQENPEVEFHLYGNTIPFAKYCPHWRPLIEKNIVDHGRITKEEMNEDIKDMTGALRLTKFDGFSEIIAKSFLWGQYPVSLIPYPYATHPDAIKELKGYTEPNYEAVKYYKTIINDYPWNQKK